VGKLGVLVCWDQWYPEAARLMALAGAELLLYPTAIGWDPDDAQDEKGRGGFLCCAGVERHQERAEHACSGTHHVCDLQLAEATAQP